ncbi:MAG: hypothetical protein KAS07_03980 [Candidatus Pacebacteria bacterium]|nr:hypothetical protein [Candidatus Paceibacterota bacterium]
MTRVKILQFNKRNILLWGFLLVLLSNFLLYTYFLNATILHIVERRSVEQHITETTIHISELETQYMEMSAHVTLLLADELGFVEPKQVVFAQRGVQAGFATLGE